MDLSLWSDGGIGWGGGKTLKFGADFWGGSGVTHDFNHFFQQSTNASKYIGFETFDRKEKKKKRWGLQSDKEKTVGKARLFLSFSLGGFFFPSFASIHSFPYIYFDDLLV